MKIARLGWMLFLAGCASIPPELAGNHFASIAPGNAQNAVGSHVRWGGTIAQVSLTRKQTCFEVVIHPLDAAQRPEADDKTEGRFIACMPGFYDPVVYAVGREVTFVGMLEAPSPGKVGQYEYLFPRLAASAVYLWPQRPVPSNYDPFWYPPSPWMMRGW